MYLRFIFVALPFFANKLKSEEKPIISSTTEALEAEAQAKAQATKTTPATASVKVNHIKAANEEKTESRVNLTPIKVTEAEGEGSNKPLPLEFARQGPKFTSFDIKVDDRK